MKCRKGSDVCYYFKYLSLSWSPVNSHCSFHSFPMETRSTQNPRAHLPLFFTALFLSSKTKPSMKICLSEKERKRRWSTPRYPKVINNAHGSSNMSVYACGSCTVARACIRFGKNAEKAMVMWWDFFSYNWALRGGKVEEFLNRS